MKYDLSPINKTCAWCGYYKDGMCHNSKAFDNVSDYDIYKVVENGTLDEVLTEALTNSTSIRALASSIDDVLMGWKVSNKRRKEFREWLPELMANYLDAVRQELSVRVSRLYQDDYNIEVEAFKGIPIKDPENYSCSHWY